jgi:hypothetical protein
MTYWESKGQYQNLVEQLTKRLPAFGSVPDAKTTNKHLEKFRKAQNCYYDLYNNGLCNKAREFSTVFCIPGVPREIKQNYGHYDMISKATADAIEAKMDEIILAAAKEQGIA